MSIRQRRYLVSVLVAVVLIAVAASQRAQQPPRHLFLVTLGINDREPTDWSGRIAVEGGSVVSLAGWRFEGKDATDGKEGWKCRTHLAIAPGEREPLEPAQGKRPPAPKQPWPNGVLVTLRGDAPHLTLTLPAGTITVPTAHLLLGEPRHFLNGRVRVERLPDTTVLRPAAAPRDPSPVQDDYPAFWVRYRTNRHYLAWVAYQGQKDRVLLAERDGPEGTWSEPIEVAGPGDHFRVAIAGTHGNTIWIVWASQREHNWDLYGRPFSDGKLGAEVRLTDGAGPDLWHCMTTDHRGRAWLAWQSFQDGQADIFARCVDGDGWHPPVHVSTSRANDWSPALAADPRSDRVWVGWDSYETGDYGIRIRSLSGGPRPEMGTVLCPDPSAVFQAHVCLACDGDGRLWAAWDQAGPQWGKDTGYLIRTGAGTRLYQERRLRIACLDDGKWHEPEADLESVLPDDMKEYNELPHLQPDFDGRLWLAFRHRSCFFPRRDGWAAHGRWNIFATALLGDRWLRPIELPASVGRNDMRISSDRDRRGNVYLAHASDNRSASPPDLTERNLSIAVNRMAGSPRPGRLKLKPLAVSDKKSVPVHPREAEQVARIRSYLIEQGGHTYHIYRGDIHRHTDISADGVGDGSLLDLHRYALDAAALDYITVTDHNMGHDREYPWWRTQKANDLYIVPGTFISMYGYERSVPYPNGHRNILWTDRGHRTLPIPPRANRKRMAEDTGELYAYLRRTGGLCTAHTTATDQGTSWQEYDRNLEPVVEIYQGYHTSYEAPDAPRAIDAESERVHGPYKPDGFVSEALARGYRLGFQSSSDHIATHVSYACVLAEKLTRKDLFEAIRKRHTYGATDNIILDVRMGQHAIMGDEVATDRPGLDVAVIGTGPIDRVAVVRDGEFVHTARPGKEGSELRFHWEDPAPRRGEKPSYYYVRVVQKDGQMAWSSPIWVRPSH